ncbi:hypothetical protein ACFVXH_39735 [Kitasatospora sp. NPDC058184]|uniref:hypothetical protein n=1 Tax=Kitasatospora sp. NPDC058184 TaxID=3346370 RepID=UPI0036D8C727
MSELDEMAAYFGVKNSPGTPDPLEPLAELGRRLDDPALRLAWRTARKTREAAAITAEREYGRARHGIRRAPAARIVDLREQIDLAHGRAGLFVLVEELAERTRLRVTTTVLRRASDPQVGSLARRISTGVQELLAVLEGDFVHPDEVHRTAEAALEDLTSRYLAARATGGSADLSDWAEAVELALAVVRTAATRA